MKLLLSIDTELDFWKYIQSPFGSLSKIYKIKWHLNKIRGYFLYSKKREGITKIVNFLKKNEIPATFNITGHLYLKSCNGWRHFSEIKPSAKWFFKEDWYYWDPASDYKSYPGLYLGDFIKKDMKPCKLFDLGLHAFSHECLPLETRAIADNSIKSAVLSARSLGITPISFSAPFNITEDIKNPNILYDSLKKNNIKIIRYMGWEDYPKKMNHNFRIIPQYKKKGLIFVNGSAYFEGTSKTKHLKKILQDISNNLDKPDAIFCLCCHDFTFRDMKNFEFLFNEILKWKSEGKIELINMKSLLV